MRTTLGLIGILGVMCVASSVARAEDNRLSDADKKDGWVLLFNGTDYTGWKCNNDNPVASAVEDGSMVPYKAGGYVVIHEKQFGDFVLKCDVKMSGPRCNSGIFFRVEDPKNPVHTGFEVQVATGTGTGTHDFGAVYDLATLTKNASLGPDQWNAVEIKCQGPNISVKVNGELVCQINCDDFDKPGLRPNGDRHKYHLGGKPRAVKDFARTGHLGFQDHGHKVWYKNVKLLEL